LKRARTHPDDDVTGNLQNILAQIGRHQYSHDCGVSLGTIIFGMDAAFF
jgi:hypothetical protein